MSIQEDAFELERAMRILAHNLRYANDPDALSLRLNKQIAAEGWLSIMVDWRFTSQGETQGQLWPALKPSTVKQRIRLGFPGAEPILHRTGELRDHAVTGELEVSPDGITMKFRDGPAPIYTGGGGYKRAKKIKKLVGTARGAQYVTTQKMLSDYAMALNKVRPFYGPPSEDEIQPIRDRRRKLMDAAIDAMVKGESIGDALGKA